MPACPTCDDTLPTELGLKQHHAKVHGESLAYKTCERCGDEFKPSHSTDQRFCSVECSSSYLGEVRSEEWQGEDHPQADPNNFPECEWCGETFHADSHGRQRGRGRFCSQECHMEWRRSEWNAPSGSNAPNWRGGTSPDNYKHGFTTARKRVRERDEVCLRCGHDGSVEILDVHHIVPVREFADPSDAHELDNLVLLCRRCHRHVEKNGMDAMRYLVYSLDGGIDISDEELERWQTVTEGM